MDISGLVVIKAEKELDCHSLRITPETVRTYQFFFEYVVCKQTVYPLPSAINPLISFL